MRSLKKIASLTIVVLYILISLGVSSANFSTSETILQPNTNTTVAGPIVSNPTHFVNGYSNFTGNNGTVQYVKNTIALSNGTILNGSANIATSSVICSLVYDPNNGFIYATGSNKGSIFSINTSDNKVGNSVSMGKMCGGVYGITYDNKNGNLYASNGSVVLSVNASTLKVNGKLYAGSNPSGLLYDLNNNYLYVSDIGSNTVSVINVSSGSLITSIGVGSSPGYMILDNISNNLYVSNSCSSSVSVINVSKESLVVNVNLPSNPANLAFDFSNDEIFVADSSSHEVSVISGANNQITKNIVVGKSPSGVLYDPFDKLIYVSDTSNAAYFSIYMISVINPSSESVIGALYNGNSYLEFARMPMVVSSINKEIYVGSDENYIREITPNIAFSDCIYGFQRPFGIAYALSTGYFYVSNSASNYVSVVDSTNNKIVENITTGSKPTSVLYDPSNEMIYVTNYCSDNVSAINTVTNTVQYSFEVGYAPDSIAYDSLSNELYVVNTGSGNVSVINITTSSVTGEITVGKCLASALFVSQDNSIYVSSFEHAIYVINPKTESVINTICLPPTYTAGGMTYDTSNGELYVADVAVYPNIIDESFCGILAINTTQNKIVGSHVMHEIVSNLMYDPSQNIIYALGVDNVLMILHASDGIVSNVSVSTNSTCSNDHRADTAYFAMNPRNDNIYIANNCLNDVSVINGSNLQGSREISFSGSPKFLLYDNNKGLIYAAMGNPSNAYSFLLPIVASNGSLSQKILESRCPQFLGTLALGRSANCLLASNTALNTVSFINTSKNSVKYNICVGSKPIGMAYDPISHYLYVANCGSNSVSIVDVSTGIVMSSINVGVEPYGILFDSANGLLYVANSGSNSISVINPESNQVVDTILTGNGPRCMIYDPLNGYIYASNSASDSISVINPSLNLTLENLTVGSCPSSLLLNSYDGLLYVVDRGSNSVSVIDPSSSEVSANFTVGCSPDGITFNPLNDRIHVANSCSDSISVLRYQHVITFVEKGLPVGSDWSVKFAGFNASSSSASISISDPNGTYSYSVGRVSGFIVSNESGQVSVEGKNQTITLTFEPSNYYKVDMYDIGLPSGEMWYVNLSNGTSYSSSDYEISFYAPNGTFFYSISTSYKTYEPEQQTSSFIVKGANITVYVYFQTVDYTIRFVENGLASGINWSVSLNGSSKISSSNVISFSETNGTYQYAITNISGYTILKPTGKVTVSGSNVTITIAFTKTQVISSYTVTFTETGLPVGTSWSITFDGKIKSSTTNTIIFTEPNGTYEYTVSPISGYTILKSSASVSVNGSDISVSIEFTSSYSTPFQFNQLYLFIGTLAVLAAVAAAAIALSRKKRK
jgi:YVTN family beta-propeller protein